MAKVLEEIRNEALTALERHGHDPSICQQVETLLNSIDDTLSDEFVLSELRAINASGHAFSEVIATL